jgi:ATP synthase protein I
MTDTPPPPTDDFDGFPKPPPPPVFTPIPKIESLERERQGDGGLASRDRATMGMMGAGLNFVSMGAGGAILGWLLDRWLGTSPILIVALLGVGLVGGGIQLYRIAAKPSARSAATGSRKKS